MKHIKALLLFLAIVVFSATVYLGYYAPNTHWRQWLEGATGAGTEKLTIGIVRPASRKGDMLLEGAQLAVNQINGGGGVLGQSLQLVHQIDAVPPHEGFLYYEKSNGGLDIAAALVDEGAIAVIGHGSLHSAKSAAVVYEENEVLFLLPYATNDALTSARQRLVFRIVPSNMANNKGLSQYAIDQGYCRIVTVWMQSSLGKESSHMFSRLLQSRGGTVVLSHSFSEEEQDFQPLLLALLGTKALDLSSVDAIYFIGTAEHYYRFVAKSRQLGIGLPIIGSESTSEANQIESPDQVKANTARYSHMDSHVSSPYQQNFVEAFARQYAHPPNFWAALGYDAVKLVAHTIMKTGSTRPLELAKHLRILKYTEPFLGVSGSFTFDGSGELEAKAIYVSEIRDDLSQITKKFMLTDFDKKGFADNCNPVSK